MKIYVLIHKKGHDRNTANEQYIKKDMTETQQRNNMPDQVLIHKEGHDRDTAKKQYIKKGHNRNTAKKQHAGSGINM